MSTMNSINQYLLKYALNGQRERFDESDDESQYMLMTLLSIVISLFAAWVSWQSNSAYPLAYKILFASFAYMFGIVYLIAFAFFKM